MLSTMEKRTQGNPALSCLREKKNRPHKTGGIPSVFEIQFKGIRSNQILLIKIKD